MNVPMLSSVIDFLEEQMETVRPEYLKLAVINCPYDNWDNSSVRDLFCRIIGLKLAGYRGKHPYGALPLDTTDFVATHVAIGIDEGLQGFRPIMAYKTVTQERCKIHNLPFPALTLARASGGDAHARKVEEIL